MVRGPVALRREFDAREGEIKRIERGNETNCGDRIDWWLREQTEITGAWLKNSTSHLWCVVSLVFERMDARNFNGSVDDVRVFALPIKRRRFYRVVNFSSRVARRRKSFLPTARNCRVNWSRCSEDSCENFIIFRFYACHFS